MVDETPVRKYPFVVNNSSNEVMIAKAVTGLHAMVELGAKAQAALDALEREGHYDKKVVWAELNDYDKGRLPTLRKGRFPAFVSVSREDLACMSTLSLSLGNGTKGQYGGHPCVEHILVLSGQGVCDVKGKLEPHEIRGTTIGSLRVSGRVISFLEGNSAWQVTTRMKKLEPMIEKAEIARDAQSRMAMNMKRIVVCHASDQQEFSQRGADLFRNVEDWLMEGGHVKRMLVDVLKALHVLMVMED